MSGVVVQTSSISKLDTLAKSNGEVKSKSRNVKQAEGFLFGAVGGAAGAAALYPAEATKMRMQAAAGTADGGIADGFFKTIAKTLSTEGAPGLYKGIFSTLMGVAPERALLIGMNQAMREATLKHQDPQGRLPIGLELASGGLAGLAQVLFSAPKEMIMIQMQLASQGAETGVVAGAQASPLAVIKQLGLRGLYAGSSATALREIPFAACYFTAYSQLKGRLLEDRAKLSFLETLGCATVAAAPPAVLVTPADVIKTNMQAQAQGDAAPLSLMAQGKSIVQEGGVRALFVGATPRALMKAPQFGIALLVVETLKDLANPPHSQAR
mmetsp:Transcript_9556/g.22631  ORF Transcript_9556/g.22631 Transcript_9556/m.22631 type:complete len:325 (-) Transcript_9556:33-1007(-)